MPVMKTVVVDVSSHNDLSFSNFFFREHQVEKGDKLVLSIKDRQRLSDLMVGATLLLFGLNWIMYYYGTKDRKQERELKDRLTSNSFSTIAMQNFLEAEAGIKIDVEVDSEMNYNPLDEGFGLWEDNGILLDEIRTKAWVRAI